MLRVLRKMMCMSIPEDYEKDGNDIEWEDTCEFTLPVTGGRVIKVYDADTITIAAKLPFKKGTNEKGTNKDNILYRFSVRLNGIDAPEMKGKGITEEEKTAAHEAKQFVSNLILNKYVTLQNVTNEKYGRILSDVYIGDTHLNELLLKEHYVVPYDGGTKKKPSSWIKYKITGEMG